jgi:hypothetical protein
MMSDGRGLILQTRFCVFRQGLAFNGLAKVKCVMVMSGGKIQAPPAAARAFASKIMCPSLHFIGKSSILLHTLFVEDQKSAHPWLSLHKFVSRFTVVLGFLSSIVRKVIGETKVSCECVNFFSNSSRNVKPFRVNPYVPSMLSLTHGILCAGDNDFTKAHGEELVEAFADPLVIRHPAGHTVPKLGEIGLLSPTL